ncbi:hypothetical protein GCM10020331_090170 [Ectobacillus funiculus]
MEEDSVWGKNVAALIKEELLKDPFVSHAFAETYCQEDDFALIPVHPLQARKLFGGRNMYAT